ncbi:hypothetical protein EXIGLDRAFT_743893 [Exidia glandulosa HHB12029]|uniref:Uncharacterized protein n=1 Tax=Exidia glandulosa HHB12029 TaxID=1314781 RepID=A0A165QCC0_EXIGL|nr:hypothetical protein EXIGLDRAFT_743893 [Exidia glandulosa HHB12029]
MSQEFSQSQTDYQPQVVSANVLQWVQAAGVAETGNKAFRAFSGLERNRHSGTSTVKGAATYAPGSTFPHNSFVTPISVEDAKACIVRILAQTPRVDYEDYDDSYELIATQPDNFDFVEPESGPDRGSPTPPPPPPPPPGPPHAHGPNVPLAAHPTRDTIESCESDDLERPEPVDMEHQGVGPSVPLAAAFERVIDPETGLMRPPSPPLPIVPGQVLNHNEAIMANLPQISYD